MIFPRHSPTYKHPRHWQHSYRFNDHDKLPKAPGLYAVMRGRKCLYIGRSNNLHRRWNSTGSRRHHRYWLASLFATRLKIMITPRHEELEGEYIAAHYTPWNGTKTPWFHESKPFWGRLGAVGWWLFAKRRAKPNPPLEATIVRLFITALAAAGVVVLVSVLWG